MSTLLLFPLPKRNYRIRFYELQDDAMSRAGLPPRRGDICSVAVDQVEDGKPHLVKTSQGAVLCGYLRLEGKHITLEFLNPDFPSYSEIHGRAHIIGTVENFFCAVGNDPRQEQRCGAKWYDTLHSCSPLDDKENFPLTG